MTLSRVYIGAFLIAIAAILFWVLLMPTYDNVMAQREAITERSEMFKNRSDIIANIATINQEYAKKSADVARFASIVPAQKSAPELVSSLQALATQNGLQLMTIALSGDANKDINSYQVQSIDLGLNGSYPAFKSFLIALERNTRLIDIISIDASPTSDNSPIIGFRVKGNAYYLK